MNPDEVDILRAENASLQAELETLRSANAMLRKIQPVVLEGDAARSFALAAELSETKQKLAHMTEAYDTQARVHDRLNKDYIAVRDELAGLRADIEAGRMVRVPCKIGSTVFVPMSDGTISMQIVDKIELYSSRKLAKTSSWNGNYVTEWTLDLEKQGVAWFTTEQAARAAKESNP